MKILLAITGTGMGGVVFIIKSIGEKMNLLFITTDLAIGGVTTSLQNLSSLLVDKGHKVSILTLSQEKEALGFHKSVKFVKMSDRE